MLISLPTYYSPEKFFMNKKGFVKFRHSSSKADNLECKQTHRVKESVNTSIALIHYLLNSAQGPKLNISFIHRFALAGFRMGARLRQSAWKIMTFIDIAVICILCLLSLRNDAIPIDFWWSSTMILILRAGWTLPREEMKPYWWWKWLHSFPCALRGLQITGNSLCTLTRGPGSNTDSWPLLCFVACPNIWNLPPLQKSIPQSHKSLGNKPGSRIHWEPSSLCGVWRGWRGQRRWVQLGTE